MSIDYSKLIHPEDERALAALEVYSHVGLNQLINKVYALYDRVISRWNLASKIRLSRNQFPEIYNLLPPICEKLGIEEPEFYLEMNPYPNAYTMGDENPAIVINSGLVEHLTEDELRTAIAHECGHILCHHVKYLTVAHVVMQGGSMLLSDLAKPLFFTLTYWCRRTEFSADRVAAWVMDDVNIVLKTLLRLTSGSKTLTANINIEEYKKQISVFDQLCDENTFDKVTQSFMIAEELHPLPAVRCMELLKWWNNPNKELPLPTDIVWSDSDAIEWN